MFLPAPGSTQTRPSTKTEPARKAPQQVHPGDDHAGAASAASAARLESASRNGRKPYASTGFYSGTRLDLLRGANIDLRGLWVNQLMVRVVPAADRMAVDGVRVPSQPPTAIDVTVALANEDRERGQERQLADIRADPAPKLVAVPGEDVDEVGVEPVRHEDDLSARLLEIAVRLGMRRSCIDDRSRTAALGRAHLHIGVEPLSPGYRLLGCGACGCCCG